MSVATRIDLDTFQVLAGRSRYRLRRVGEDWRIARRESVLITDYATTALDLYHL